MAQVEPFPFVPATVITVGAGRPSPKVFATAATRSRPSRIRDGSSASRRCSQDSNTDAASASDTATRVDSDNGVAGLAHEERKQACDFLAH